MPAWLVAMSLGFAVIRMPHLYASKNSLWMLVLGELEFIDGWLRWRIIDVAYRFAERMRVRGASVELPCCNKPLNVMPPLIWWRCHRQRILALSLQQGTSKPIDSESICVEQLSRVLFLEYEDTKRRTFSDVTLNGMEPEVCWVRLVLPSRTFALFLGRML